MEGSRKGRAPSAAMEKRVEAILIKEVCALRKERKGTDEPPAAGERSLSPGGMRSAQAKQKGREKC